MMITKLSCGGCSEITTYIHLLLSVCQLPAQRLESSFYGEAEPAERWCHNHHQNPVAEGFNWQSFRRTIHILNSHTMCNAPQNDSLISATPHRVWISSTILLFFHRAPTQPHMVSHSFSNCCVLLPIYEANDSNNTVPHTDPMKLQFPFTNRIANGIWWWPIWKFIFPVAVNYCRHHRKYNMEIL